MTHVGYLTNRDIDTRLEGVEEKLQELEWMMKEVVSTVRMLRRESHEARKPMSKT